MNKFYTILAGLLITATTFSQSPESMSYQAVVRDGSDILVSNTTTPIQISILQGTTAVYVETQTPTTNANGLLSIEIGGSGAVVVSGVFSDIIWGTGTYFIKTEVAVDTNASYDVSGSSQLLSVPYALHAKTADNVTFPSMTQTEVNAIVTPVEGMVQFNTDAHKLQVYSMLTDNAEIFNDIYMGSELSNDDVFQSITSPIDGQIVAIELLLKDGPGFTGPNNIEMWSTSDVWIVPSYSSFTWFTMNLSNPIPVTAGQSTS